MIESVMKRYFFLILLLVSVSNILYSQKDDRKPQFFVGAYASYNSNIHDANFTELPGVPSCCTGYKLGDGSGFSLGGLFEYPLNRAVSIGVRLGYSGLSGTLSEMQEIGLVAVADASDINNVLIESVTVNHYIDASIHSIGLAPYVSFNFFESFYMDAGFRLSNIYSAKADHYEKLVNPVNVTFLDGRLIRNDFYDNEVGELNSIQFHGVVGAGYELPVAKDTYIVPEIRFNIPLTNISSVEWKVGTIQFGAAFKYPIYPPFERPVIDDLIYERDTVFVERYDIKDTIFRLKEENDRKERIENEDEIINRTIVSEVYEMQIPKLAKLDAKVSAVGISANGKITENPELIIEEVETIESFPLLPYVFFEEGSSDINKTGMNFLNSAYTEDFTLQKLPWNTLGIYSDLLNIIGRRMTDKPGSKITVTGCNSGLRGDNDLNLSEKRANAIKGYLVDTWGIDKSRIQVKKRSIPEKPANIDVVDGQIENQRAEISSNDFTLLKPIELKENIRHSSPPVVMINPEIESEAALKSWTVEVKQQGQKLREWQYSSAPKQIKWNVEEKPIPELNTPVEINLTAYNEFNHSDTDSLGLKLTQRTIKKKRFELKDDKIIERFSLILFDYDKADITPNQKDILQLIKQRIKPESKVYISGYADRTGEPDYNRELASRRINEVQKIIKVAPEKLESNPVGSDILLYNNDLPQGRGYSRTVQIVIESPVSDELLKQYQDIE